MTTVIEPHAISRFKKLAYLKSLSEDDFRDLVVRPLFLRLGFGDGRDTCGPTEQGKDALFTEKDSLGLVHVVAVQTKAGNLNMSSKASSNIIAAITQLRTALDTSVVLLSAMTKCMPIRVYLCASGKINDAAKRHILEEVNDPRIQFLDADDLIPRVDEVLPESWYGIDTEILPYFRAVKHFVEGSTKQTNETPGSKRDILVGAATDEMFVSLNLFRNTTKTKTVRGQTINEPDFEEFPIQGLINKKYRRTLLIGEAGAGKSTALHRIAYVIAEKGVESEKAYKIPILLRANDLIGETKCDFRITSYSVAGEVRG